MKILEPVAIIGAGMMGTAIAAAHMRRGIPVVLYDNSVDTLKTAPHRIAEELRLQDCSFHDFLLICSADLPFVSSCPVLIETITEKIRAKQKLYETIEAVYGAADKRLPHPYLFTNTSTISIAKLAEVLSPKCRKRFCGFHFFHPVRENSLLEIIPGRETDPATVETASRHAWNIDKRPITVGDGPGFLVNRILNPYLVSAQQLLYEGVPMEKIERVATDFGMRMGPFRIMDEIGLDVVLHAGWVMYTAFPDRVPESLVLIKLVELRRLGRKTGRGFMLYPNSTSWDGDGRPDPELPLQVERIDLSEGQIVRRLFFSMYEEALRCHDDGIISDLADADLASTHALGFPVEKGGIVQWGAKCSEHEA